MKFDWTALEDLVEACAIVLVGLIMGPVIRRVIMHISRKVWDKGAMTFIGSLANVAIISISVIIAMDRLGINTSVLVGAFSALGLGISLALKDNMANVAGGLQILITRPFKVGDFIKVGSHSGYVRAIELMYSTLETWSGKEVIVPNAKLISKTVVNATANPVRRVSLKIPVYKFADVKAIEASLWNIIKDDKRILKDPAPSIQVEAIHDNYSDIYVYAYCSTENYWPLFYDLYNNTAIAFKDLPEIQSVSIDGGKDGA